MLGSLFNIIFDLILDDTFSFQVRDEIEIPDMITLNFNLQSLHIWCKWSCISKILELSLNQEIWKINSFNRESKGRSLRSYLHFLHLSTTPLPVPTPWFFFLVSKISSFCILLVAMYDSFITIYNVVMNTFWHYLNENMFCCTFMPKGI